MVDGISKAPVEDYASGGAQVLTDSVGGVGVATGSVDRASLGAAFCLSIRPFGDVADFLLLSWSYLLPLGSMLW